ncbi:hypothetical protein MLD38_039140 [Melastoma candidum]|uniref:Uncharacterized protein n=1 Tax=Melastoma candidum TaxID=119954 RepID=A0ACB9L265_9MYRT|nr:hypothetical protein MLD38_039140 [Melastoma candidum]
MMAVNNALKSSSCLNMPTLLLMFMIMIMASFPSTSLAISSCNGPCNTLNDCAGQLICINGRCNDDPDVGTTICRGHPPPPPPRGGVPPPVPPLEAHASPLAAFNAAAVPIRSTSALPSDGNHQGNPYQQRFQSGGRWRRPF